MYACMYVYSNKTNYMYIHFQDVYFQEIMMYDSV